MHSQKCRLAFTGRTHMYIHPACQSSPRLLLDFCFTFMYTPLSKWKTRNIRHDIVYNKMQYVRHHNKSLIKKEIIFNLSNIKSLCFY